MSANEEEEVDLNLLDFNDPTVIQTLKMTMMEIVENEHREIPLQESRSRTMLRGTHTLRSSSYPFRNQSGSRVNCISGYTVPMMEEQPSEELRQMGEPHLGNYLLDYARRRVYICLSTPIVGNNYYLFKQAMHKSLHLNDKSANNLRRIWDEVRSDYHKRLIQEIGMADALVTPRLQRTEMASGSQSQRRPTEVRPSTTSRKQSQIPTLRTRTDKEVVRRTERTITRISIVDISIPTTPPTSIKDKLAMIKKTIDETSVGNIGEANESANLSTSPEPASMNVEEQGNIALNSSSLEQKDENEMSDIRQGLGALQLNEPTPGGSKKKEESPKPSGSGIQSDDVKAVASAQKTKIKRKDRVRRESSSTISNDEEFRQHVKPDSDPEDSYELLAELFSGRRRRLGQLLQPPRRVTSKPVEGAEKKSSNILQLEDVYNSDLKKELTEEEYEKKVLAAQQVKKMRKFIQEMDEKKAILEQKVAERRKGILKQTTASKQKTTTKQQQNLSPQQGPFFNEWGSSIRHTTPQQRFFFTERGSSIRHATAQQGLFFNETSVRPAPTERHYSNVRRSHISHEQCEYCRMMFKGELPVYPATAVIAQLPKKENPVVKPKRRVKLEPDSFLIPPPRRLERQKALERERRRQLKQQVEEYRKRVLEREERKHTTQHETYHVNRSPLTKVSVRDASTQDSIKGKPRKLSPTKKFEKVSESAAIYHMVTPPRNILRNIMRPAWFPETLPLEHQPRHIKTAYFHISSDEDQA